MVAPSSAVYTRKGGITEYLTPRVGAATSSSLTPGMARGIGLRAMPPGASQDFGVPAIPGLRRGVWAALTLTNF